jgi:tRNA A-37 threonylcarbamoyl transferase component Bud32
MADDPNLELLATCLDEWQAAAATGEPVDPEMFRVRLGGLYAEFRGLVDTEAALDRVLEPEGPVDLPRTFGEYTLVQELGRGAMGVVYKARHRTLDRDVAVKVLRSSFDTDEVARQRFKREAKALAKVSHDHIVEVFGYGEVDGNPYYSMALVEGPTLAELRKKGELPSPAELCRGLAGVADALHALHEATPKPIVHRDVKPGNIMLDRKTGRYMLADFGLARDATAVTMTRTGDALGTPLYMSPEQILGKKEQVNATSDVYGLGTVLYEMLAGRPPFKTDDMAELMQMVLKRVPPAPSTFAPSVPRECDNIALKCLAKEQRDRYATAGALCEDLRAFAEGRHRDVRGIPVGAIRRGVRQILRHPALAAAVLLAIALPAFLLYGQMTEPTRLFVTIPGVATGAEVFLDGEARGEAPSTAGIPIEPGRAYQMAVVPRDQARYHAFVTEVRAAEKGRDVVYPAFFQPRDPGDMPAQRAFAASMGVSFEERLRVPSLQRSGSEPDLMLIWPRGAVRPRDLAGGRVMVKVKVGEGFRHDGRFVFLMDGTEVGTLPWGEAQLAAWEAANPGWNLHQPVTVEVPAELHARFEPGRTVTWRYEGSYRDHLRRTVSLRMEAGFQVVPDGIADAVLEKIDAALTGDAGDEASREATRVTLRARALSALGLHQAAFLEIDRHLRAGGRETLLLLALQATALEALGVGPELKLVIGRLSEHPGPGEAQARNPFTAFDPKLWSPEEWAAVFGAPEAPEAPGATGDGAGEAGR